MASYQALDLVPPATNIHKQVILGASPQQMVWLYDFVAAYFAKCRVQKARRKRSKYVSGERSVHFYRCDSFGSSDRSSPNRQCGRQLHHLNIPEFQATGMRLYPNAAGIRIGCLGLAPERVSVGKPRCLLPIETYNVRVPSHFDFIGVPLSGNQRWAASVDLLIWILTNRNSVHRARTVFIKTVGISSRQFVDLNLEAGVNPNECLVVVRIGHSGQIPVGNRKPWIPEANENSGIVVNSAQLELQSQDE